MAAKAHLFNVVRYFPESDEKFVSKVSLDLETACRYAKKLMRFYLRNREGFDDSPAILVVNAETQEVVNARTVARLG